MSTRKRLELEELFEAFDRDKDGKVSPQELQNMLQSANMATDVPAMVCHHYRIVISTCLCLKSTVETNPHRSRRQSDL